MTGLAEALANAGKDVIVLADGKEVQSDKTKKYKVLRFSGWKPIRRLRKAKFLRSYIKKQKVEMIYADSWKSIEYLDGINLKIISLAHGTEIPKNYFDKIQPFFDLKKRRIIKSYRNCSKIAANSNYTKDLMIASLNINPKKISIIHPGVDVYNDFIQPEDKVNFKKIIGSQRPIITTLARVERRKGHIFIINAISELRVKFPNLLYLIAGKGPYLNEVIKHVEKLKLQNNVTFLGWITEPEKSLVLRNSDLFIMTPTKIGESVEGFGMAFIDAAFHSLATIGTNSGGIKDAIKHQVTGLICKEADQEDITKCIDTLLSDNDLRKKLGNNGRQLALQNYAWKNKVREYLKL